MMRQISSLFLLASLILPLSSCYYYYPADSASASNYSAKSVNLRTNSYRRSGSSSGQTYIVRRGDTLYSISRRYGRTVNQLIAWNNIRSVRNLQVGQRLWVAPPSGSGAYYLR